MRQVITDILTQFQNRQITLQEAVDRLLTQKTEAQARKARSNRRLKSLCNALQQEQDPAKVQEIKTRLSHEFYHGDEVH